MTISYDTVITEFLSKVTEYELTQLAEKDRASIVDGYMKRAAYTFGKVCKYNLSNYDDITSEFADDFDAEDVDEIVDILSEGMVVQWLKP